MITIADPAHPMILILMDSEIHGLRYAFPFCSQDLQRLQVLNQVALLRLSQT
jgi:hypothetical protein